MKNKILPVIVPVLFLLAMSSVFGQPIQPCSFWGEVSIAGSPAPFGTEVLAYNSNEKICGTYVIGQKSEDKEGYYGFLSCVNKKEQDFSVSFKVNGIPAKITGNSVWNSGATKKVDLIVGENAKTSTAPTTIYKYTETTDEAFFEVVGGEKPIQKPVEKKFYHEKLLIALSIILILFVILFVMIKRKEKREWI